MYFPSRLNFPYLLNARVHFKIFIHEFLCLSISLSLQSKICTWLSADWGGCTTRPFYTSQCTAWREVFTSHAWRSWTNYIPSFTMVRVRAINLCVAMKNHSNFLVVELWFPYQSLASFTLPFTFASALAFSTMTAKFLWCNIPRRKMREVV
jgi:hypothetical protein